MKSIGHWSNKPEPERRRIIQKMSVGWGRKPKTGKWVECAWCGKKIYRKLVHLKRSKHFFCNTDCFKKFKKGKIPPNIEQARKNSPIKKGSENINWKGGIPKPYSKEWTGELKRKVFARDENKCQDCGKIGKKRSDLICHHIDFNKKNCLLSNLILLCRSCHMKRHWKANIGVPGLKSYNGDKL